MRTSETRQARPEGVAVVERAVLVQQLVAAADEPLALREIARRAALSPTTTRRLAQTLEGLDLLHRDTHGRYVIGDAAQTLATPPPRSRRAGPMLDIVAKRIVERFDESATVTIDVGDAALYSSCRVSRHDVQVPDVTGDTSPFHLIASGVILMATWDDERLDSYLARELAAATDASITDPDELRQRVEIARRDGYAWSVGESLADITAIAVPVRGRHGAVLASVGLYGPSFRLDPRDVDLPQELTQLVTSTVDALGI